MKPLSSEEERLVEEAALVQNAQAGDRDSFAILVERYWDRLYRWLFHMTHDPHVAEDLAQETFLKAFGALASFRAGTNFRAWLFRIGHNNFVNQRRATRHQRRTLSLDFQDPTEGPPESLMGRETVKNLLIAVHRLPTDFREALLLRVEEELSFREIAEIQQITEETARWRVFKARQKLMQVMESELVPKSNSEPERKPR